MAAAEVAAAVAEVVVAAAFREVVAAAFREVVEAEEVEVVVAVVSAERAQRAREDFRPVEHRRKALKVWENINLLAAACSREPAQAGRAPARLIRLSASKVQALTSRAGRLLEVKPSRASRLTEVKPSRAGRLTEVKPSRAGRLMEVKPSRPSRLMEARANLHLHLHKTGTVIIRHMEPILLQEPP